MVVVSLEEYTPIFYFKYRKEFGVMGKYMKKTKLAGDVSVKDVSQSYHGVRTRAKTLALQRLQYSKPDSCYLELRSRRLEKHPLLRQCMQHSLKVSSPEHCSNCREKEGFVFESLSTKARVDSASVGLAMEEDDCFERQSRGLGTGDLDIEGSFGENFLQSEARERSTRESTPCSLIMAAETITTPDSTTKRSIRSHAYQRPQNAFLRNMPTAAEIEDFFTQAERSQHLQFMEKYNFDIVNDLPLPGRYEWEILLP